MENLENNFLRISDNFSKNAQVNTFKLINWLEHYKLFYLGKINNINKDILIDYGKSLLSAEINNLNTQDKQIIYDQIRKDIFEYIASNTFKK
ncbi:MAG: hypothetical protein GX864_03505 [Mollicutes bacterium]|nr:hypothetical protein [Mollicutes bacterium]